METITIDGVYGSFTTDTDGTVNHALPLGELTFTGSVSGKSFTRTVTKDITDVYVMPENSLYWYGNISNNTVMSSKITKEANRLLFTTSGATFSSSYIINSNTNKTAHVILSQNSQADTSMIVSIANSTEYNGSIIKRLIGLESGIVYDITEFSASLDSLSEDGYLRVHTNFFNGTSFKGYCYALWLE